MSTKLYMISFAKTAKDTPRTATLFYDIFESEDDSTWKLAEQHTVTKLNRDEQLAHLDTIMSVILIPGSQEDDTGMNYDKDTAVAITDRVAIGVIQSVKELHTLRLAPDNTIIEASKTDPDERRFVQKDFIAAIERLFKDYRKYDTSQDIFTIQKELTKEKKPRISTIRRRNGVTQGATND